MPLAWKKSPPELIARFDAVLPSDGRVERRTMFGFPCAFANGHMFTGLHEDRLFVRLSQSERSALLMHAEARPFEPMPGRPMAEYVVVPGSLSNRDLAGWLDVALCYVTSLPPKQRRKVQKRASR